MASPTASRPGSVASVFGSSPSHRHQRPQSVSMAVDEADSPLSSPSPSRRTVGPHSPSQPGPFSRYSVDSPTFAARGSLGHAHHDSIAASEADETTSFLAKEDGGGGRRRRGRTSSPSYTEEDASDDDDDDEPPSLTWHRAREEDEDGDELGTPLHQRPRTRLAGLFHRLGIHRTSERPLSSTSSATRLVVTDGQDLNKLEAGGQAGGASSEQQGPKTFWQRNQGLWYIAGSQLFFSLMNLFVKLLNTATVRPVPALEIIFIRQLFTYVGAIGWMLWSGTPDPILGPAGVRSLLACRGVSGFFGLFGIYYSLGYLSLSDATVLTFLGPLLTGLLASLPFTLRESFTAKEALAGVLSLFGVVLIARPKALFGDEWSADGGGGQGAVLPVPGPENDSAGDVAALVRRMVEGVTEKERLVAVGIALVGILGGSLAYISIRAIGKQASALHSIAYFSLYSVFVCVIGMVWFDIEFVVPTEWKWGVLLACVGVFGFLAQCLLTLGLQREKAGRGSMMVYLQIIFSTVFQFVFLHKLPELLSVFGSAVILGSGVWVMLSKEKPGTANSNSDNSNSNSNDDDNDNDDNTSPSGGDANAHERDDGRSSTVV